MLAFGAYTQTQYRLDQADIVLALDAEGLSCGSGHLRYAHDFAQRRKPSGAQAMSRFYAIESTPTAVGALADHRLALPPSALENFVRALAVRLGIGAGAPGAPPLGSAHEKWADALAGDLKQHRGASVIIAGEPMPPAIHALAHVLNNVARQHWPHRDL